MFWFLKQAGGAMLGLGLLAVGLSGMRPGWTQLGLVLGDPALFWQAGLALVGGGLLTMGAGHVLERRDMSRVVVHGGTGAMLLRDKPPRPDPKGLLPQARVCLKPVWPPRETAHWVGGLPHLPEDVAWPVIDGQPACFQAQIALSEMPRTLWHGKGPRTGWLVIFSHGEHEKSAVALHVDGAVSPRKQPKGVRPSWNLCEPVGALRHLIGPKADVPPRWGLELVNPACLGAVEDMADDNEGRAAHYDSTQGRWVWEDDKAHPIGTAMRGIWRPDLKNGRDWLTPLQILAALHGALDRLNDDLTREVDGFPEDVRRTKARIADLEGMTGPDAVKAHREMLRLGDLIAEWTEGLPAKKAALAQVQTYQAQLSGLEADVRGATGAAYDPTVTEDLYGLAEDMTKTLRDAFKQVLSFRNDFEYLSEAVARRQFAKNPARADALTQLYAPAWQEICDRTTIFLGTNRDMPMWNAVFGEQGTWARLIDLPPNALTGITYGDASRYFVDVALSDLDKGDLSQTSAASTHGTF